MKVAFTGHRPQKLGGFDVETNQFSYIIGRIHQEVQKLEKEDSNIVIISGMALGIDQWAARYAAVRGIPFLAYVPFNGQEGRWPSDSRKEYFELLRNAKEVKIITQGAYAAWKMQRRNEAMVNDCDVLIAVWDGSTGGTGNCVDYAKSVGKRIVYIHPFKEEA